MAYKIFIDGQSGTTGLNIFKRLKNRTDIYVMSIDESKRRDLDYRKEKINESDITFLCLPDDEAKKSVYLLNKDNKKTKIIDTSTAHRIDDSFVYGFPELCKEQRDKIKNTQFISNPGCHATGFISILNPLIRCKVIKNNANIFSHSITGYSGGGKSLIDEYTSKDRQLLYNSPRQYSTDLSHKHLPEMQKYSNLLTTPFFNPIIGDFYNGMAVSIPLFKDSFTKSFTKKEIYEILKNYYEKEKMINVYLDIKNDIIQPEIIANKDILNIYIYGNDEQIEIVAIFDNLGKGACGSAIMNMNIILGIDETVGLYI